MRSIRATLELARQARTIPNLAIVFCRDARNHRVRLDRSADQRSRPHDAAVAHGHAAEDRDVGCDPSVIFDMHGQRDFGVIDVDRVLVRIEDARPHPDQHVATDRDFLLRGQHAGAELRLHPDRDACALCRSQENGRNVRAKPNPFFDDHTRTTADHEANAVANALRHDAGPDHEFRVGSQVEPGRREVRARARVDAQAGMATRQSSQAQSIPDLDESEKRYDEEMGLGRQCVGMRAERVSAGPGLAFAQSEGDEAVGGIVRGQSDRHAIARNHPNAKAPHSTGQLSRDLLTGLQRNLVATPAQNLVDTAGCLNEIVSRQLASPAIGYIADPF